jgi:hypothetical protein
MRTVFLHGDHRLAPGTTYQVAADVAAGLCGLELADEAPGPANTTLDGLTWPGVAMAPIILPHSLEHPQDDNAG